MKRFLIVLLAVLPTAAMANPTAMLCLFKPLNARFNIVVKDGEDMIQWEGKGFQAVVAVFEDPYLTIKQYGTSATFKAVIDAKSMNGYGGIVPFTGKATEGDIICAWD
jgi:hypothetical protein